MYIDPVDGFSLTEKKTQKVGNSNPGRQGWMAHEGSEARSSQSGRGRSGYMRSSLGQVRTDIENNKLTSQKEMLRV